MSRDYDGVDDVVHVATQTQNVADFTMCVWAYADTTGEGGAGLLFALDSTRLIRLTIVSATALRLALSFGTLVTLDATNFALGEWAHWAIRYRTSDDRKEILKDAVGSANNLTDPGATSITGSLCVGARTPAGDGAYDGLLADFRWWDAYLTDQEIQDAANGLVVRPEVIKLWWPLWGTLSPEPDSSANGLSGTVVGTLAGAHPPTLSGGAIPTIDGVPLTDKTATDTAKGSVTIESEIVGSIRSYSLTDVIRLRDALDWAVQNWSE